jgi:hypothetical protein
MNLKTKFFPLQSILQKMILFNFYHLRAIDGDDSSFTLAKYDLVLGAGESKRVCFCVLQLFFNIFNLGLKCTCAQINKPLIFFSI